MKRYFTDHGHISALIRRHSDFSMEIEEKIESKSLFNITDFILTNVVSYVDKEILLLTSPKVIQEKHKQKCQLPQKFRSPSHVINRILYQIAGSTVTLTAEEADEIIQINHATLQASAGYRWVTKTILILASFASLYGDFWHFTHRPNDQQAECMAQLKSSGEMKRLIVSDTQKRKSMESLHELIKGVLVLTRYLFQLDLLCREHQKEELAKGILEKIPRWSCQAILVIIAITIQFVKFITSDDSWEWELFNLSLDVGEQVKALELELERLLDEVEYKALHVL